MYHLLGVKRGFRAFRQVFWVFKPLPSTADRANGSLVASLACSQHLPRAQVKKTINIDIKSLTCPHQHTES